MAINETLLSEVATLVEGRLIDSLLQDELIKTFPDVRITLCSDDDIHAGKPVMEKDGFDIYLVGSSEHCLTLTNDIELATGVVIAEKYPEEE